MDDKHIDTAIAIVDDPSFAALLNVGRVGKCAEIIAAALAEAEREATTNLISIIADIRMKSGVGAKPMLGELADAIADRVEESHREGMKRAAEIATTYASNNGQAHEFDDDGRWREDTALTIAAEILCGAGGV